jgi:hypothetical protein
MKNETMEESAMIGISLHNSRRRQDDGGHDPERLPGNCAEELDQFGCGSVQIRAENKGSDANQDCSCGRLSAFEECPPHCDASPFGLLFGFYLFVE